MFLMSFFLHGSSAPCLYFIRRFNSSFTNFQHVRDLLGVQLRSFQYAYFFSLKDDLTSHIKDPLCEVFRSR